MPETVRMSGSLRGRDSSAPPVGGLRAVTWRALSAAAADVVASWPLTEHASISAADVRVAVGCVTDAVRSCVSGGTPRLVGLPSYVPVRRVVDQLRTAFLTHSETPDDDEFPVEALAIVRAIGRSRF